MIASTLSSAAPGLSLQLRLLPMGVSGVAHAALIAALIAASPLPRLPLAAGESVIEVSIVDEPEAGGAAPVEAAIETPPVPPTIPDLAPVVEPAMPVEPPQPEVIEAAPPPPPAVVPPMPVISKAPPKPTPVVRAAPRSERKAAPPAARSAQATGTAGGAGTAERAARGGGRPGNAASGAAYAGRVRAILQGRAHALGIEDLEGSVGVTFVIGASGRMESHAITRSSGSGSVDRLIRGMLASASFPPPPGGRFAGSVTIRIQ
jgi:protein TonB